MLTDGKDGFLLTIMEKTGERIGLEDKVMSSKNELAF